MSAGFDIILPPPTPLAVECWHPFQVDQWRRDKRPVEPRMEIACPFCNLESARLWLENAVGIALPDAFAVSQGHTLVIPRQHVASLFDLSPDEQAALWRLVAEIRHQLQERFHPDGFNM
jgi:hypothetical protein